MSDSSQSPAQSYSAGDTIRPLSVRLLDSARAQLEVLAQLNGRSVTEEVRLALESWIETSRSNPAVQARASEVRAEIEREAAIRRDAILSIFDQPSSENRRARGKATADE